MPPTRQRAASQGDSRGQAGRRAATLEERDIRRLSASVYRRRHARSPSRSPPPARRVADGIGFDGKRHRGLRRGTESDMIARLTRRRSSCCRGAASTRAWRGCSATSMPDGTPSHEEPRWVSSATEQGPATWASPSPRTEIEFLLRDKPDPAGSGAGRSARLRPHPHSVADDFRRTQHHHARGDGHGRAATTRARGRAGSTSATPTRRPRTTS